jgi:uncharacterized membrane protein (DUF4010 family)
MIGIESTLLTPPGLLALLADTPAVVTLFQKAAISLVIGALVGLEREHASPPDQPVFAGIRTFPLIALFGCLGGLLADTLSTGLLVAFFVALAALVTVAYYDASQRGDRGATSAVTALLVFSLGALVYYNYYILAIASSVVITLFLSAKTPLHNWVDRLSSEDIYATLKFALITAIVLPILPDQTYGPFDVLNPRQIWYMVILIAGLSFLGYVMVKILGSTRGITATGVLGGLISSTAVSLSLSRKSHEAVPLSRTFVAAILLASTIMYPRVIVEVGVVNRSLLGSLWPFITILTFTGIGISLFIGWKTIQEVDEDVQLQNPFRLASAIQLGILFAGILVLSKVAATYYGDEGLLLVAAFSGLADVDAMTLSAASLAGESISEATATTAIMIAAVANTLTKGVIVVVLGTQSLRKHAIWSFGLLILVGILTILWTMV